MIQTSRRTDWMMMNRQEPMVAADGVRDALPDGELIFDRLRADAFLANPTAQCSQFVEQPLLGLVQLDFQGAGIVHGLGPPAGPHPIRILSVISDAAHPAAARERKKGSAIKSRRGRPCRRCRGAFARLPACSARAGRAP